MICEACSGRGFDLFDNSKYGLRIERCDTCGVMTDVEANELDHTFAIHLSIPVTVNFRGYTEYDIVQALLEELEYFLGVPLCTIDKTYVDKVELI